MNRLPPSLDTDSPHSLHSPSLHFDLITSPPSFLSFFLSFLFLPFHQRSSAIPFARFLTSPWFGIFLPCFHSLEKLNSGNCWSAHLAREPSSGHRQTWKTRFSSTRDALLTHRIYTIKSFVLLHTCFPRITRSLSLSISKGSFVQGRKFYSMIFLNERNVFGTIVGYRIFNEHPSTVPLRVRRRIPSYEIKKKRKGKVIYMERKLFSLSRIFIERSND